MTEADARVSRGSACPKSPADRGSRAIDPPIDHADSRREAGNHRLRNELDDPPHAGEPHQQQDDAGHDRRYLQAGYSVLGRDSCQYHYEGTGRTGNLYAGATEYRCQTASDDRGVQTLLRTHA